MLGPSRQERTRSAYTAEDAWALEKVSDLFEGIHAKLLRDQPGVREKTLSVLNLVLVHTS
jgi:hypothetical protein